MVALLSFARHDITDLAVRRGLLYPSDLPSDCKQQVAEAGHDVRYSSIEFPNSHLFIVSVQQKSRRRIGHLGDFCLLAEWLVRVSPG